MDNPYILIDSASFSPACKTAIDRREVGGKREIKSTVNGQATL